MSDPRKNVFTEGALGGIFLKTALPIIFVMGMNGLLTVADALFLGHYVGPDALAAVTLMFPAYMLIVALSTLVASGMSSVLARALGAQQFERAQAVFAGAHGLAIVISLCLIGLYFVFGTAAVLVAAGGSAALAEMGQTYLRISVLSSPLMFVLSVNSDALRNEGRVGLMAAMSLLVSVMNMLFNYMLIAQLHWGVAGSAYGTLFAQLLAIAILLAFRLRGQTALRPQALSQHPLSTAWREMLALGAPQSLSFVGLALGSATIIYALQMVQSPHYADTVSAYGIITRILTFVFLPLLGLSHAMQSITGNNFGAQLWHRSNSSLKLAMLVAFVYCLLAQLLLSHFAGFLGQLFVSQSAVVNEVARIMPVIVQVFCLAGPLMMIGGYFQATGDVGRAAILGLCKPFLFGIPLTLVMPRFIGEPGVWLASPVAELLLLLLTLLTLVITARRKGLQWGLFHPVQAVRS